MGEKEPILGRAGGEGTRQREQPMHRWGDGSEHGALENRKKAHRLAHVEQGGVNEMKVSGLTWRLCMESGSYSECNWQDWRILSRGMLCLT